MELENSKKYLQLTAKESWTDKVIDSRGRDAAW